jgi:uncharacterized protein YjaG (DUF416 family)
MFEKIKAFFKVEPKVNYEEKLREAEALAQHWEFKYNRLYRELKEALERNE